MEQQNDGGISLVHSRNSGEVVELEVRARGREAGRPAPGLCWSRLPAVAQHLFPYFMLNL